MNADALKKTAARCRHYAMCKIDFLGTGLCPPGKEYQYVSYYPQGRMDLFWAVNENLIPVTEKLVHIARSCSLCGICDKQCHFVTGMRPLEVMAALKDEVERFLKEGRKPLAVPPDDTLNRLRGIVGADWATNDPAVLVTYANDPFPLADLKMPAYVVLPGTRDEVASLVLLANELGLPYVVRGNGGSVFGFVFTEGIVLDMARMRSITLDTENWSATVGPGVTSFELQAEAYERGFRVNAAEPSATVCGNIVCTGTFSTWSNVYGTAADNFIDMEFVDREGKVFRLNDKKAPNVLAFEHGVLPSPGICTEAVVKLHPMTDDEEGILVPFPNFEAAVDFARDLGRRRIGLAVAVLGPHYISTFMSPSKELAEKMKRALPEVLGIHYMVFVVGDGPARQSIRYLRPAVIDSGLLRILMLGLPNLVAGDWVDLIQGSGSSRPPYELLCRPEMRPLVEAALSPSAETLAGSVDEDLKPFYSELYKRPEMTDMVWLNMFRIVSPRMGRSKHMFAFLVFVPLEKNDVIKQIIREFGRIADSQALDHDYGFLTPLDMGKRAILEYDYYFDHTDHTEKEKIKRALAEIEPWLDALARTVKGVLSLKYVFSQGCSRKENILYRSNSDGGSR